MLEFLKLSNDKVKCIYKNNTVFMDSVELFDRFCRLFNQMSYDPTDCTISRGILSSKFYSDNNSNPILILNFSHNCKITLNSKKINEYLAKNNIFPYITNLCKTRNIDIDQSLLDLSKEIEYICTTIYGNNLIPNVFILGRNYTENIDMKNILNHLLNYNINIMFFDNITELFDYFDNPSEETYLEILRKKGKL